jgi:hypothetical protein
VNLIAPNKIDSYKSELKCNRELNFNKLLIQIIPDILSENPYSSTYEDWILYKHLLEAFPHPLTVYLECH